MTLAAEHLNWLWSFCTDKSITGPCLGAVCCLCVQAPSSWKKKRGFRSLPSQVSAVLTNSFPYHSPPFPYGSLSGPLLMQPDLEILCTSSEAADLPYLLLKLSSTPQR